MEESDSLESPDRLSQFKESRSFLYPSVALTSETDPFFEKTFILRYFFFLLLSIYEWCISKTINHLPFSLILFDWSSVTSTKYIMFELFQKMSLYGSGDQVQSKKLHSWNWSPGASQGT
jgi:hypothetical protein